jgi:hypothetical protein
MSIFIYKKAYLIDLPHGESVELIKIKYSKLLNVFKYETSSDLNGISFKRKFEKYSFDKSKGFVVFREGTILINLINNKLEILWSVRLDHLFFISILVSIISGIFTFKFFNLSFSNLILTGIISFLISFSIGRFSIMTKIAEINLTCLEE